MLATLVCIELTTRRSLRFCRKLVVSLLLSDSRTYSFTFRSVEFSIRLFSCHFRISKLVQGQLVFASHAWKPSLDFFILSSDFVLVALSLINADMNPLHLKVQIKERRWEKKRRTNSDYFFIAFQYLCLGRRYVMIEFVVWPECVYFTVICCILRCRSQTPE